LAAIFFGIFILPRKHSESKPVEFQVYMSPIVPALLALWALLEGHGFYLRSEHSFLAALAGGLWAVGSVAYSASVDRVGVARSTYIKNFGPILVTVFGILFFREFTLDRPLTLILALVGSAAMAVAATLVAKTSAPPSEHAAALDSAEDPERRRRELTRGLALALFAGLCFAAYTVPLNAVLQAPEGYGTFGVMTHMGVGVLLSGFLLHAGMTRRLIPPPPSRRELWRAQAAGASWVAAAGLVAISMRLIPMGVSWPITNLSALVTLGFGAFYFREIHLGRHRADLAWSTAAYLAGLALLTAAVAG
jgi:drug/metabolite transporter (DMT)-like permease